jgi:hypothetical protein
MARRFTFSFDTPFRLAALPFGVSPERAWVDVGDGLLTARFGPWMVETPLANVAAAERTGPYSLVKVIGPAHLSLADQGLTFAGNAREGVCIHFEEPVAGIEPTGRLRHPGLTVTVADVAGLVDELAASAGG